MCGFSRRIAYLLTFMVFVATLFFVIGTATPNWLKDDYQTILGNGKTTVGLTQQCDEPPGGGKNCQKWDFGKCDPSPYENSDGTDDKFSTQPCNQFKTAQSLSLLACLLSGLALLCLIFMLAASSVGSMAQIFTFLMVLGAGVCGMIAMSTYAALAKNAIHDGNNVPGNTVAYDFSFGLMIVGWILCYVCYFFAYVTGAATGSGKISGST